MFIGPSEAEKKKKQGVYIEKDGGGEAKCLAPHENELAPPLFAF